jgi:hypothetical protein
MLSYLYHLSFYHEMHLYSLRFFLFSMLYSIHNIDSDREEYITIIVIISLTLSHDNLLLEAF